MRILGIIASSLLKLITDTFTRTTSGSLGTSDSGQVWSATRGTWFANGSQAVSNDSASGYPLASVSFAANTTVSATVSEATGVSYWVTDSNNWYATVSYATQSSYSCGCSTCCNTCVNPTCSCATCATCSHTGGSCGSTLSCTTGVYCSSGVNGSGCYQAGSGCTVYISGTTSTPITCTNQDCDACGCATYNSCASCDYCGSYSCGCSTCYTNNYYMRLLKAISGTVSTVISDYSVASLPASLKVITNNGTITSYAYSDTGLTTLIGTVATTPSSPLTGSGVGIIKTPAAVSQGTTVDNFSAS